MGMGRVLLLFKYLLGVVKLLFQSFLHVFLVLEYFGRRWIWVPSMADTAQEMVAENQDSFLIEFVTDIPRKVISPVVRSYADTVWRPSIERHDFMLRERLDLT